MAPPRDTMLTRQKLGLPADVAVTCKTTHGGNSICLSADFGLQVEIAESFSAPYFILAPCCGLKLMWAEEEGELCSGCGAKLAVPAHMPRVASRRELSSALPQWLSLYLDPMAAILAHEPLLELILTLHAAMEDVSARGLSREELGREWGKLCVSYSGSLFSQ